VVAAQHVQHVTLKVKVGQGVDAGPVHMHVHGEAVQHRQLTHDTHINIYFARFSDKLRIFMRRKKEVYLAIRDLVC
jgi:hypothetical protein